MNSKELIKRIVVVVMVLQLAFGQALFAATTDKDLTLDDGTGDSPSVILTDADGNTLTITKNNAGEAVLINNEGGIDFKPSADTDDFLRMLSIGDSSYLYWLGVLTYTNAPGLRVDPGTGKLEYRDEDESAWTALDSIAGSATFSGLTDTTISGIAQGDVVYYNGTSWVNLGPGTAGQVLQTGGAAADPSWATVSGSIADGTAANNTLRWDGSGWVESTALTNDGNDVAMSGNVGIGTTGPAYKLDVTSTAEEVFRAVSTKSGDQWIKIFNLLAPNLANNENVQIAFGQALSTGNAAEFAFRKAAAGNYISIGTNGNPSLIEAYHSGVVAFPAGNVGIGTTNPGVALDVSGDIRALAQGDIRLADSDSSNYVAFQAPAIVATDVTWTLPAADGTADQVLSTDGSGALSWSDAGVGGGVFTYDTTSTPDKVYFTDGLDAESADFIFGSDQLDDDTGDTTDDYRMFFDKSKGAFRAGAVTGTEWDAAKVGLQSFASGYETTASNAYSTAMGEGTITSGDNSTAMGFGTDASGYYSTAMGEGTTASNAYSTAMGRST